MRYPITKRELFRDIPGYEGLYQATNLGRIFGVKRGRELSQFRDHGGYMRVNLYRSGCKRGWMVHKLVVMAFRGEYPDGCETMHKNNIRDDNQLSNLKWGTKKQNQKQRRRDGTSPTGSNNGRSKLREGQVKELRRRYQRGERTIDLLREYAIAESTFYDIINRRKWKHI